MSSPSPNKPQARASRNSLAQAAARAKRARDKLKSYEEERLARAAREREQREILKRELALAQSEARQAERAAWRARQRQLEQAIGRHVLKALEHAETDDLLVDKSVVQQLPGTDLELLTAWLAHRRIAESDGVDIELSEQAIRSSSTLPGDTPKPGPERSTASSAPGDDA